MSPKTKFELKPGPATREAFGRTLVELGRENKDICIRLKDDIEKAHREYDRRFRPIMDHPVDYFYRWMVEILADGDNSALGEYTYTVASKPR